MLALVEVRSRKNANIRAIVPTMTLNKEKSYNEDSKLALRSLISKTKDISSLKKALKPFAIYSLRYYGSPGFNLTNKNSLGILSVKLYDLIS
jgi:hypothetical protein